MPRDFDPNINQQRQADVAAAKHQQVTRATGRVLHNPLVLYQVTAQHQSRNPENPSTTSGIRRALDPSQTLLRTLASQSSAVPHPPVTAAICRHSMNATLETRLDCLQRVGKSHSRPLHPKGKNMQKHWSLRPYATRTKALHAHRSRAPHHVTDVLWTT